MSDIELKPCPFCRQHLVSEPWGFRHPYDKSIVCPMNGMAFTLDSISFSTWNTRGSDTEIKSLTAKLKAAEEALEGIHAISLCTETFASIDTVKEVKDMSRQALEAIRSGKHE